MKRTMTIVLGLIVLAIAAIAYVTVSGPLVGKVFSTINGRLDTGNSYSYATGGAGAPASPEEYNAARDGDAPPAVLQPMTGFLAAGQERMVIKNADLTIVVKDPVAKMQAISTLATNLGGYVVSSNTSQSYVSDGSKVPEGTIMIRVPQEKLAEALEQIKAEVVEVQNDTLSGQDVTKEYTDLSSQLKNLQATEKKLTEIMDKAEKTEDVLAVFNQLTQIRGQIEVIVGQMKYYEQSAAMSAISVRILAEKTIKPIDVIGWRPEGQVRDAIQALVNFFQGFVDFLIWLVLFFLPVVIVLLLLGLLLWRVGKWVWRKVAPKAQAKE